MSFFKVIFSSVRFCDKVLWAAALLACVYSLAVVKSISREGFNYFSVQFLSVVIGLLAALFLQALDYRFLLRSWRWIAFVCAALLISTFFLGVKVEGSMGVSARAWLRLPGGITFQPSELVKIGFTITFARHLAYLKERKDLKSFGAVFSLGFHAFVPVLLTHLQGDDGAAIIFIFTAASMAFLAGVSLKYFVFSAVGLVFLVPFFWRFVLADYQKKRILAQLSPESDPLGMGYQQIQGKLSLGSGGIFGYGLFGGPRVARGVVPVQESDFVFSAVGEELGFLGCILVLVLILVIVFRLGSVALKCGEDAGSFICFGLMAIIVFQTIFNVGMCLSLLPVMGVTLPFFSVGGSSLVCLYIGLGIAGSVYLNRRRTKRFSSILECERI